MNSNHYEEEDEANGNTHQKGGDLVQKKEPYSLYRARQFERIISSV